MHVQHSGVLVWAGETWEDLEKRLLRMRDDANAPNKAVGVGGSLRADGMHTLSTQAESSYKTRSSDEATSAPGTYTSGNTQVQHTISSGEAQNSYVTSESEGSFPPIGSILDAKFKWTELEDRLHSKLVPADGEEVDSAKLQNSLDARLMKLRAEMQLPADRRGGGRRRPRREGGWGSFSLDFSFAYQFMADQVIGLLLAHDFRGGQLAVGTFRDDDEVHVVGTEPDGARAISLYGGSASDGVQ